MSRTLNFQNNFNSFQKDFTLDTGLKKEGNVEAYINYVNARTNDKVYQMSFHIINELSDKLAEISSLLK